MKGSLYVDGMRRRPPLPDTVAEWLADRKGLTIELLREPRRDRRTNAARKEAMARCRRLGLSYPAIGRIFDRHHTTVMAAVRCDCGPREACSICCGEKP